MNTVTFPGVVSNAGLIQSFVLWKGINDNMLGRRGDVPPTGFSPMSLIGATLTFTLYVGNTISATLSSSGTNPAITLDQSGSGVFTIAMPPSIFSGLTAGVFDHAMSCTLLSGASFNVWSGTLVLIAVP